MTAFLRALIAGQPVGDPGQAIRFTASTDGVKRDGMALRHDRWLLENYQRNPVVLWAHDYSGRTLPIGRADVVVDGGQRALVTDITFDQADEFARQVEAKYRGGYLHAVSVGWNNVKRGGDTWHELLDISAVPVPGDPDALIARQVRALQELLTDDTPEATTGEPSWAETAGAMLRLFSPDGDDPDDEARRIKYNALLPAYRRYGRTAPEFLDATTLGALTTEQLQGLFLGDEMVAAGAWAPVSRAERAGAVLSAANRRDLEQAIGLIQAVMARAQRPDDLPVMAMDAPADAMAGRDADMETATLTLLNTIFTETLTRMAK